MKKLKHENLHPVVTVVVLSYNRPEYTSRTLESLTTVNAGIDFELVVVDNGSDAPAVELLKEWERTGLIDKLLYLPENLGTSPGFNKGFSLSHPESLFLTKLDNDILVQSDNWLLEIVNTLNDETEVGIAATYMINHSAISKLPVITLPSGRHVKDWSGFRAGGGGMTFRKDLFYQLGGFKMDFPAELKLMPDDIDFYHKVTKNRMRSYYVCAARSTIQREHETTYAEYQTWKGRQYHLLKTRFFGVARGKDHFKPFISNVEYTATQYKRGERIIVSFSVSSIEESLCWVGMSLKKDGKNRYVNDEYADIMIKLQKGNVSFMRWFHIPEDIDPGVYDVSLALYSNDGGKFGEKYDLLKEAKKITIESSPLREMPGAPE